MISPGTITLGTLPSVPLEERRDLPVQPGIYFVLTGTTVLYIGQARSFQNRWLGHHRQRQLARYTGCRIAWLYVDDVSLLDALEDACIAHFQPVLNGTPQPQNLRLVLPADVMEALRTEAQRRTLPPATAARMLVKERLEQLNADAR